MGFGAAVDDPVHPTPDAPATRGAAELPPVGRHAPHVVAALGVQVNLGVGHGRGRVALDGHDRRGLNVGTTLADQRLLPIALDHRHDVVGAFQARHVRIEDPGLVEEGARGLAAPRIDGGAPAVDEPQDGDVVLEQPDALFEVGQSILPFRVVLHRVSGTHPVPRVPRGRGQRPLGIEKVMMRLVNRVTGQAGHREAVDAVASPIPGHGE